MVGVQSAGLHGIWVGNNVTNTSWIQNHLSWSQLPLSRCQNWQLGQWWTKNFEPLTKKNTLKGNSKISLMFSKEAAFNFFFQNKSFLTCVAEKGDQGGHASLYVETVVPLCLHNVCVTNLRLLLHEENYSFLSVKIYCKVHWKAICVETVAAVGLFCCEEWAGLDEALWFPLRV